MWVYIVDYQMSQVGTFKFWPRRYDFLMGCSYYLYISHYFWIAVVVKGLLIKHDLGFSSNLFLCMTLTLLAVLVSYGLLLNLLRLCRSLVKKCLPSTNNLRFKTAIMTLII